MFLDLGVFGFKSPLFIFGIFYMFYDSKIYYKVLEKLIDLSNYKDLCKITKLLEKIDDIVH